MAEGTASVDRRNLTLGPLMGARGAPCWSGCRVWEGRCGVTWAGQWWVDGEASGEPCV